MFFIKMVKYFVYIVIAMTINTSITLLVGSVCEAFDNTSPLRFIIMILTFVGLCILWLCHLALSQENNIHPLDDMFSIIKK